MENKPGYYITLTSKKTPELKLYFRELVFIAPQFEKARLSSCIFESLDVAIGYYNYLINFYEDGINKDQVEVKINEYFVKQKLS